MQLRVPAGVFYVSIVASMQEIFRSSPPFPCAAVCDKTSLVSRRSVYLAPQPVGTAKTVQEMWSQMCQHLSGTPVAHNVEVSPLCENSKRSIGARRF